VVAVGSDADGDSRAPASGGGGVRAAGDNTLEASDDKVPALVAAILAVGATDLCLPPRLLIVPRVWTSPPHSLPL
jgi:hypothetical protein